MTARPDPTRPPVAAADQPATPRADLTAATPPANPLADNLEPAHTATTATTATTAERGSVAGSAPRARSAATTAASTKAGNIRAGWPAGVLMLLLWVLAALLAAAVASRLIGPTGCGAVLSALARTSVVWSPRPQTGGALIAAGNDPGTSISIAQFLSNVRLWLLGLLATVTVCCFTVGGIRMLLAGDDPAQVERAKSALRSGAWGFLITVMAPALVGVLQSLVQGGGG